MRSRASGECPVFQRLSAESTVYGSTWKGTLLESVALGVTTWTVPVVAPVGTVAVISEGEFTLNIAGVPLNVTLDAPVKLVPRISMDAPAIPVAGCGFTNGLRPADTLNTVPQPTEKHFVPIPPN